MKEQSLFPVAEEQNNIGNSTTFQDNMKLPIHRWYRYTAGFSGAWVGQLLEQEKINGRSRVLDPFAGSGTVLVEAMMHSYDSYGIESNPYVFKIAKAKLEWKAIDIDYLHKALIDVVKKAKVDDVRYPALIERCFSAENLNKLTSLKKAYAEIEDTRVKDMVWFIITSILRSCSFVGTAQWQYIQPKKTKANVLDPYFAFRKKVSEIIEDIQKSSDNFGNSVRSLILKEDSRDIKGVPDGWADLVVTSPPYANNYDYADAMRFEMLFWNDISGWEDLQEKVSVHLIRACTQHVSSLKNVEESYLNSDILSPIREEIIEKYKLLEKERLQHGGKKNYHKMIAAYFYDMAHVFASLNRVTSENCKMCFVIGDSAPYGIYIPVDEWLGRLCVSAGFTEYHFEKLRDRNIKWKNRKHRVPLKEGRLWINK